jgi:hypothetical protein
MVNGKRGGRRQEEKDVKKRYKEEETKINSLVRAAENNRVQQVLFLLQVGRLDRI